MCVIGVEMTMGILASPLIEIKYIFSGTRNFHMLCFVIVQLCYFVVGRMRTVVHNQGMYELKWRVSFLSFG